MARRVKWTGNPADLPQPQETTKKRTVRYVGMGPGGNTYQPYAKPENNTARTVTVENTAPEAQSGGKGFFKRAGLTVSGGAKGSLAGNMDAMGVAYEAGQGGRTQRYTDELREAQWAVARAKHDYDADPGNQLGKNTLDTAITKMKAFADTLGKGAYEQALTAAYDVAAKLDTGDLKALYNGLGVVTPEKGTGTQQKAASAARDLAYEVQKSASEDLQRAKEGASKFGQMLVDAGASMTQMGLDTAANALMGTQGTMIPFATRAFGGSTMDARQDGADLKGQALYGGAQAAKEVFTEKMFNIALPFAKAYGKGGLDQVVENGIHKAAEKLGKSDIGRAALEKVLKFGASAASEGLEEFVGDFMEWQMPRIYGGDTDSLAETFSNALYDFAVGTISGAAGGAVGNVMDSYNESVQARETEKAYAGREQELLDESKELNPGNDLAKKYQERLDNGKKLSGRQLMRLIEQNETDAVAGDKAKIQSAAEGRLTQLGETGDAAQIAQAITKQVAGEKLSTAEQSLIDESRYGRRVANEIDPENVKAVVTKDGITPRDTFASEWTGKLDTKRIYPEVFNRLMPQPQKTKEVTARQKGEVTGAKYNAETGRLDAIVTNEAGKVKTVPAAEAEMTPMQEELFDWADELKLEAAGPLMVRAYQPEQNMELYTRSFKLAYEYGKAGMPMDYVEKSEGVNYLHPTQIKLAYEEGQAATQRRVQTREERIRSGGTQTAATNKKPSVSLRGATVGGKTYAPVNRKTVDSRQWASVKAMRAFSRAVGVDVVFYQSQANERGVYEGANGFYKGGKLYLDINAGRDTVDMTETAILKTAAHELTHFIQANSAQYEALKSFVVNKLTHEEGVSFEDLVADKRRREPGLEYDEAVDEVVADACEMMLGNSTVVEQLAKENRSLAEKIRDWLREWVENLKIALEGLQADRTESRAMMQYARELQEIWDNALMDAARNNRETVEKAAPAESRQSIRETSNGKKYVKADRQVLFGSDPDSWSEQLEDYINGKIRRGQDVQLIAEDGDVLLLTRTSAGKLSDNHTSDGRTMSDAAFERKANAAAHIDELVEVSSKGKKTIIDKDARHGDMASGGWNYRTAYFMDFDGKYYKTTISVAEGSGGSIVYNVGKMQERSTPQIGGSSGKAGALRGNASTNSIRQSNDNSQEKSSDKVQSSMRDSAGRELTEAQQAYFKDSKVRDADGKLLVMYHQTEGTFTVFDTKHKGAGAGDDETPFGIFLKRTPRNIGVRGEKQMELYADIRNPLRVRDRTELVSKLRELSVDYARLKDESAQIDKEYGAKFEEAKNAFKSFLIQWRKNNPDAPPRAAYDADGFDAAFNAEDNVVKEWTRAKDGLALQAKTSITQALRDNGYDGVILENDKGSWGRSTDAYIALDANQVKNTTNKTPTADPDIRYQQRDSDKTGDWDENGNPIFDNTPVRVEEATDFAEVKRRRKAAVEDYGLEKNESMRIESYVSGLAYELNKRMNSGILSEQDQNYADKVRDAFRKFPQYKGTTFRNLSFGSKKAFEEFLLGHKKGEVIKLKAFTSTSKSPNGYKVSGEFIVHMEFRGESNADISETYGLPRQQEVVYMPGTEIRVSDVTTANDGNPFIIVEEVGIRDQRANIGAEKPAGGMESNSENGRNFTGGENEFSDGVRGIERNRYVGNDALSERGKSDPGRSLTDSDVKNQQRDPRLSDRDVLRMAADMAQRDRSQRWSVDDLNRFDLLQRKLLQLDEANAELEALKEERKVLLAGRKVKELTRDEQFDLAQNRNRTETQKGKIQRLEEETYKIESVPQVKALLKKSRSIVEADAAYKARSRYREQRYEGQRKAVERRKVERVAKKLITDLNTNNDKKHIPEPLKRPIGELLESLDFISGDARANKKIHRRDLEYGATLRRMKDALDTYRKNEANGTDEGADGYIDLPEGLLELMSSEAKRFEDAAARFTPGTNVIASMSREELSNLHVILSSVREGIVNIYKMFQNEQFERVKFIGEETMRYLTGKEGDAGAIKQMAMWDNTLPWYAFQRFGQGGRSIFEELMDGQDKFAYNANRILKFRKALIKDKTVRAWDKEIHELELTTHEGERVKVTMTTTQLMNLYLLSRRKHGLNHILGGGIRLKKTVEPTLVNTVREKVSKDKKKLNQEKTSEHFKLKDAEVGQLLKLLTPEQIEVARALQKFAAEVGGAWGNEITMRRFGFRGFTEENYWTIEVDKQDLSVEPGDKKDGSLYRLQNISAVKPLTEEAKGAVVIRGVFDVFSDHMTDMAKYNAFVLPIIDAQRWLNYKTAHENNEGHVNNRSVQRAMTKVYGAAANNYVIEFLRDLNGVKESGDRGDTLTKRMISKAKRVKVALNFNVAAQQPTSYMRASAVLEHKYLAKAFAAQERDTMKDKLILEQDRKELLEYSGIALWKEMGFFDTDIGHSLREQIKGGQSLSDKIADKTMLGAEWGDKLTWARLWRACKLEVQDKQHLTGEELLKAAAKRFREVIYRTQVVDSTLTRSHNMRSNSTFAKFSTTFMSEPTVSYNVAMYATENMVRETAKLGLKVAVKRNWRQVIRQYQAVLASSVAAALVNAINAALRDPDDDPFFEKVWKEFFGEKSDSKLENAVNIILGLDGTMLGEINPLSKLPELKSVVNTLSGFGSGRMDMDVITNAQRAVQIWDEYIRLQSGDLDEPTKTTYYGNMTPYGRIYPTLKALSDFSGLPISNLSREAMTLFNTGCWAFGAEENKVRTYQSKQLKEAWENYGKASGVSYAVMYRATQDTKEFESDKDADGNTISGSLKAKYVEYIRSLGLPRAQEKAVWEAAKVSSWSDKGTPWG